MSRVIIVTGCLKKDGECSGKAQLLNQEESLFPSGAQMIFDCKSCGEPCVAFAQTATGGDTNIIHLTVGEDPLQADFAY